MISLLSHSKSALKGCESHGKPQTERGELYQVHLESIVGPAHCCLSEPELELNKHLGKKGASKRMKGLDRKVDDFCRLREGCQQGTLPTSGVASVCIGQWQGRLESSGIPHNMLQCRALYPNVMPHLRSAFNNATHLTKSWNRWSCKSSSQAINRGADSITIRSPKTAQGKQTNQIEPLGTSNVIVCKCWLWITVCK